jgi:hypothetical protein
MKNQVFQVTNALAVLVLLSASGAASAKVNNHNKAVPVLGETQQQQLTEESAKRAFRDIRDLAIGAASDASELKVKIQNRNFAVGASECPELNSLKIAINQMGKHVLALEASRENLNPSQREILDQVLPLLQHATANVAGAIEYAKTNPTWLVTAENQAYVAKVERDARHITGAIDEYLKRR